MKYINRAEIAKSRYALFIKLIFLTLPTLDKKLLNQTFHLTMLACLYIVRVAYQCYQTVL